MTKITDLFLSLAHALQLSISLCVFSSMRALGAVVAIYRFSCFVFVVVIHILLLLLFCLTLALARSLRPPASLSFFYLFYPRAVYSVQCYYYVCLMLGEDTAQWRRRVAFANKHRTMAMHALDVHKNGTKELTK